MTRSDLPPIAGRELSDADWLLWLSAAQPHIDQFTLDVDDPGGDVVLVAIDAKLAATSPALAPRTPPGRPWVGWLLSSELGALITSLLSSEEQARLAQHLLTSRQGEQRLLVAVQAGGFGLFRASRTETVAALRTVLKTGE